MHQRDIRRINYGHFVRPASETGTGFARVEPTLGYAVGYGDAVVLFDTGLAEADPETQEHYRPHRRPLVDALAAVGVDRSQVAFIVNSHLHFDHCGGNSAFPDRPIIVQSVELANARTPDYTVPSAIDFDGARYEESDGEIELMPHVTVIPTPGHTEGHQSLLVECEDGTVVCAGQATDFAFELGSHVLRNAMSAQQSDARVASVPRWLEGVLARDPRRFVFAHDLSELVLPI